MSTPNDRALPCPECGAGPFRSPQGLGSHRHRMHGVVGAGPNAARAAGVVTPSRTTEARRAERAGERSTAMPDPAIDESDALDVVGLEEECDGPNPALDEEGYGITTWLEEHERDALEALAFLDGSDTTDLVAAWVTEQLNAALDDPDVRTLVDIRRRNREGTTR